MTTQERIDKAIPCPNCGYDLRAATIEAGARRCPECGGTFRGPFSRIPWINRGPRGPVRAYLATLWFLHRHPATLAAETRRRLPARPAQRFHRISMALATILAAGAIGTVFALTPMDPPDAYSPSIAPIFALLDSPWGMLPLLLGLYVSGCIAAAIFRRIIGLGQRPAFRRRRTHRVALFVSGLFPALALTLGLAYLAFQMTRWLYEWVEKAKPALQITSFTLALTGSILFLLVGLNLVLRTGRLKLPRALLLVAVFPPLCWFLTIVILGVMFWIAGYIAFAFLSMAR